VFSGFVIIILLESSPKQIPCANLISRQLHQWSTGIWHGLYWRMDNI